VKWGLVALIVVSVLSACGDESTYNEALPSDISVSKESFRTYLQIIGRDGSDEGLRVDILNERINEELLAREAVKVGLDQEKRIAEKLKLYRRKVLSEAYISKLLEESFDDQELRREYFANQDEYSRHMMVVRQLVLPESAQHAVKDVQMEVSRGVSLVEIKKALTAEAYMHEDEVETDWVAATFNDALLNANAGTIAGPFGLENRFIFVEVVVAAYSKMMPFDRAKRIILEKRRSRVRRQALARIREN